MLLGGNYLLRSERNVFMLAFIEILISLKMPKS